MSIGAEPGRPTAVAPAVNAALIALFAWLAHRELALYPAGMHEDDLFFYLQIARNGIETGALTFDGQTATNGFHLLWMATLVAGGGLLSLAVPVETALLAICCLPLLVFAILCRPLTFLQILVASYLVGFGMEGLLAALLFIALAWALEHRRRTAIFLICTALLLTRIDFALALGPIALWMATRDRWLGAAILAGSALGAGLTFAGNWWLVGEIVSVSSQLKLQEAAAFDPLGLLRANLLTPGNQVRLAIWLGALIVLFTARSEQRVLFHPLFHASLALFLVVHATNGFLRDWYFAAPLLVATYAAGTHAQSFRAALPALAFGLALPLAAITVKLARDLDAAQTYHAFVQDLHARDTGPLFVHDGSGYIAWHLHPKPVINGDGLVNSPEFARNMGDQAWMLAYLRERGITHFLSDERRGTCLTPGLCCTPESLTEVTKHKSPHRGLSDRLYAIGEGGCTPR